MKILKKLGFCVALTGCGLALAGWCERCGQHHNGRKCPVETLGLARDYGVDPYACYYYRENYDCYDLGYDSDDEEELVRKVIQRRKEHHQSTIQRICDSLRHVRNADELRRVQDALNRRADQLGVPHFERNAFECRDFYDCHNDYRPALGCNENRYDCDDYEYFKPYGC